MVYDVDYPRHSCGRVVDYCTFQDTTIYFCIFCHKVTGAKKEETKITLRLGKMNEYDDELREALV